MLNYKVIRKDQIKEDIWSGGITKQLAIYPDNSVYKDRNFLWRLSSATVDLEVSTFTKLPNYNRILMVLDGKLEINHNDTEIINLGQFDQNEFDGANHTISKGKAVDFNLMMKKGLCSGKIKYLNIPQGKKISSNEIIGFYEHCNYTLVIYTYNSDTHININNNISEKLYGGELLIVSYDEQVSSQFIEFESLSDSDSNIIIAQIFY